MKQATVTMEVGDDGVAVITFSNPPVNALAIASNGGNFSGGFDLNVIETVQRTGDISLLPDVSVDLIVNIIEDAKKPSVAAIEGFALGGGLELAMACHARIAAPKAQLGLPELSLGVIPGAGGTQRLPRLIGLEKAVGILLSSRPITSEEGQKIGLVDAIEASEELLKVSRQWALDISRRRKPWIRPLHNVEKLGSLYDAIDLLKMAKQHVKQTVKNMLQHQACLDVIAEGIIHGGYHGVLKESEVFKEMAKTDTSKGLLHAFFAQRATTKVPNVTDVGLTPRRIKKIAVIGGGLMGSGIATTFILSNIFVVLKEINSDYLQKGLKAIQVNVRGLVSRKKLTLHKAEKALSMLKGVLDYSEFKDVDMVIEAVIENISLKQKIFEDIEKVCASHCILASNTSTIDLNIIGEKTKAQDRIVGAHFFSPANVMPLLEIVQTEKTSPQVILDLMTAGKTIKKVPVVVGNCTGFAVNRTFFPYSQSAHLLANLGVDVFRIDQLISDFGLPMGPFQLQDVAGYGVAVAATKELSLSFPDCTFISPLVDLLMKSGRNGKNNGKGYYIYGKGSKPKPDPSVLPIIEESRRLTNIMPGGKPITVTDEEIIEMVLFPVVNEACRVLDDGIVVQASDLDVASVLGMSFPSYRGGIVYWADTIGADNIYRKLKTLSEVYGNFFRPSNYLTERAARGIQLSAPAPTSSGARPRL
ncbi:peroxisomal fatty acid beta-oxidation multifunctional protein AIM1-like isoform X2 [Primulina eburnea]|uniref:peroxisomal fatty acid beta-oxidation multifunctional protein AIM1-like isoform X2 n=1 Tax=Primulina eburnea TaxID=1245227 RepID=UPI003C6BFB04